MSDRDEIERILSSRRTDRNCSDSKEGLVRDLETYIATLLIEILTTREKLAGALETLSEVRRVLESDTDAIVDTLWYDKIPACTLVDLIESALPPDMRGE